MISGEAYSVARELMETAGLEKGDILVVGCSTSEVAGASISSYSSPELAEAVFGGIYQAKQAAQRYAYECVNVMPQPKAGGSFAVAAYKAFEHPVAVEHIRAHAGIDIGDTLIGMHLRDVAVPVRTRISEIGNAHVVCARTRPKFIGGDRAVYDENML